MIRNDVHKIKFFSVVDANSGVIKHVTLPSDVQIGLNDESSSLSVFGSLSLRTDKFSEQTSIIGNNTTIAEISETVDTVVLPVQPRIGHFILVKNISEASNIEIIARNGMMTIDGQSSQSIVEQFGSTSFFWSEASNEWKIFEKSSNSTGSINVGIGLQTETIGSSVIVEINDNVVATVSGTLFTGPVIASNLSGSIQNLTNGQSYLVAGSNILISSSSSGQVLISSMISGSIVTVGTRINKFDTTFSPVGLWNFEQNLNDSSGNGLTLSSGSTITYSVDWINPDTNSFIIGINIPVNASLTGGLFRSIHDSSLAITGDITIELLMMFNGVTTEADTSEIIVFEGGPVNPEIQDTNYLWGILKSLRPIRWFHEFGLGTDVSFTPTAPTLPDPSIPFHLAVTRTSNVVQFYLNGLPLGSPSGTLTTPDGGATSTLRFSNKGTSSHRIFSAKIIDSALTATQIKQEYNHVLGGMFGTLT